MQGKYPERKRDRFVEIPGSQMAYSWEPEIRERALEILGGVL